MDEREPTASSQQPVHDDMQEKTISTRTSKSLCSEQGGDASVPVCALFVTTQALMSGK